MDKERERLIEEDRKFISSNPPNYSKKSNEQIRKRTEIIKSTFDSLYGPIKEIDEIKGN